MNAVARLSPEDAADYRALMLAAYQDHPDAFTSSVEERSALPLSWWEARLASGPTPAELVLGVRDGQALIGVAGLSFETRAKVRHKATLFGMVVAAAHRHRRVGRALVQAVLNEARQRAGVRVVLLTVTQGNTAAEALYARCGFVPFGIEPLAVAVGTGFVSKVHMACDLSRDYFISRCGSHSVSPGQ